MWFNILDSIWSQSVAQSLQEFYYQAVSEIIMNSDWKLSQYLVLVVQ